MLNRCEGISSPIVSTWRPLATCTRLMPRNGVLRPSTWVTSALNSPLLRGGSEESDTYPQPATVPAAASPTVRSEEHTSELQSLMRISYAVFCLKKKTKTARITCAIIMVAVMVMIIDTQSDIHVHG